ncbi:MAG: hypothetical protein WCP36_06180 [Methanomicrobiales archaeon]
MEIGIIEDMPDYGAGITASEYGGLVRGRHATGTVRTGIPGVSFCR